MPSPKEHIERLAKAIYRQYIGRHHEFILCQEEKTGAEKLSKFLLSERCKTLRFTLPYGIDRKYPRPCLLRPAEAAYDVIRALLDFMFSVHGDNFSFNGKLSIDNIYWLPKCKKIKIWGLITGDMVAKDKDGMISDFRFLSDLISTKVFRTGKVPKEPRHLLSLMKTDPLKYSNLIKYNIALLDDEEKVAKYIILHQKLVLAKMVDEEIYAKALTYISCGRCDELNNWYKAVLYHPSLVKLLNHNSGSKINPDEEGATVFGRHACHHLLKYAVKTTEDSVNKVSSKKNCSVNRNPQNADGATPTDVVKKTSNINMPKQDNTDQEENPGPDGRIKFTLAEIFPILECFVPGLFSQLQEAVFEIIEKQYPEQLCKLRSKISGGA